MQIRLLNLSFHYNRGSSVIIILMMIHLFLLLLIIYFFSPKPKVDGEILVSFCPVVFDLDNERISVLLIYAVKIFPILPFICCMIM